MPLGAHSTDPLNSTLRSVEFSVPTYPYPLVISLDVAGAPEKKIVRVPPPPKTKTKTKKILQRKSMISQVEFLAVVPTLHSLYILESYRPQ